MARKRLPEMRSPALARPSTVGLVVTVFIGVSFDLRGIYRSSRSRVPTIPIEGLRSIRNFVTHLSVKLRRGVPNYLCNCYRFLLWPLGNSMPTWFNARHWRWLIASAGALTLIVAAGNWAEK